MDIRVRDVDPAIVKVIDGYAKARSESRNTYLKKLLKYHAQKNLLDEINWHESEKTNTIINALSIIINQNKSLEFELQKLLAILIYSANMDQYEVNTVLDGVIKTKGENK